MPKPAKRPETQYKVVQQSYEDKDYQDNPKPVLVAVKKAKKSRQPMVRFGEDMPEDFTDKRNMRVTDDTAAETLFEDEDECDFDNDFIKSMMTGEACPEDFEEMEEIEEDNYPKHDEKRVIERQFDRAMADFDNDEEIDEEDARAHGALSVMDYAPALEEFVADQIGGQGSYFSEVPTKHRGLINQLHGMAAHHKVFDSDDKGYFKTLPSDKATRMGQYFHEDKEAMRQQTLALVKSGKIDSADVLHQTMQEVDKETQVVKMKEKAQYDCQTILSTYSTLYNHPSILQPSVKGDNGGVVLRAPKRTRTNVPSNVGSSAPGKNRPGVIGGPKGGDGDDVGSDDEALMEEEEIADYEFVTLNERPKDESAEEKKMRRAMVKEVQRQRRVEKKELKNAYKAAHIEAGVKGPQTKAQKAQMSLSVVRTK